LTNREASEPGGVVADPVGGEGAHMFSFMPAPVTLAAWAYSANGRAATRRSACRRTSSADSRSVGLTCGVGEGFDGSRVTARVWPSGKPAQCAGSITHSPRPSNSV
jgi:hypothetical protein